MKVQALRGFRDYLPKDMLAKSRMLAKIREVFEAYGYPPIETPALEYSEILLGKYGEEGELLMYRFRDNGDRDVCMRYDLTVPLARLLAEHSELKMPFRRYHIGTVWRAEKPGKGRYREFMQCDVDLVGAHHASADAEMLCIDSAVLRALGVEDFEIRVNHRGILKALTRFLGLRDGEPEAAFLRLLDKLEKIGTEKFATSLKTQFEFDDQQVSAVMKFAELRGSKDSLLQGLQEILGDSPELNEAVERLQEVFSLTAAAGDDHLIRLDPSIARGLSYYTGIIYETSLLKLPEYGSVMSGGRYDDLVGSLSKRDLPAVGISLGVDRLFSALQELACLEQKESPADVLVVQFDKDDSSLAFALAQSLRLQKLNVALFPTAAKLKKQYQFANNMEIPFTAIVGKDEAEKGVIQIKQMESGEQRELNPEQAAAWILEAKHAAGA